MTGLLLIHGFLTCTDDWDLFLPVLEPMYDKVVLFRQPGHARADEKPCYREFKCNTAFDSLEAAVRELERDCDVIDIAGHSMGGGMAIFAAAVSVKVRRAVLLAPALKYPRPGSFARHKSAVNRLRRLCEASKEQSLKDATVHTADNVEHMFRESIAMFRKRLFPHWSPHNLLTFVRIMHRAEKYIPKVSCPVTVLWGELDEFIPRRSAETVLARSASKEKTFIRYGAVGHAMMYLGDVRIILRDVACALAGENPCDIDTGECEERIVRRMVAKDDGTVEITEVMSALKQTDDGVTEVKERRSYTERPRIRKNKNDEDISKIDD